MDTKKERTADEGAYWRLAFGVWRLAFGVWRLAFGVWRSAFGVRRSAFGVWAFRRFVERCLACEADGGGGAWADWRPEGTE